MPSRRANSSACSRRVATPRSPQAWQRRSTARRPLRVNAGWIQPLLPAAQSMPNSSISLNTTPGASLPKRTSRRPASPG
ncbi:Uncharacterised protein [Bordetella pertussis]|nr:Uncharacterised protein [Bordetella pertussis]CFW44260.1 Uncharacterised protein [Bordetella pertussis]